MSYPHAHYFGGRTSIHLGHSHVLDFFTFPVNGSGCDGHYHDYSGVTKYAEKPIRHFHRYDGLTGPAIPLPNGAHYHQVSGDVNDEPFQILGGAYRTVVHLERHTHSFCSPTGIELGKPPAGW